MAAISTATYLAAASAVGTAFQVLGAIQQGQAQRAAGEAAANAATHRAQIAGREAEAAEISAGQERAAAQREAFQEKRRAGIVGSRAKAVAAASGGALDSPDIENILSGIETEGDIRSQTALYGGEERGRQLEHLAMLKRAGGAGEIYSGEYARSAGSAAARRSYLTAGGTLLEGAGRAYNIYRDPYWNRSRLSDAENIGTTGYWG